MGYRNEPTYFLCNFIKNQLMLMPFSLLVLNINSTYGIWHTVYLTQHVVDDVKSDTPSSGSWQRFIFSTTSSDGHVNIQAGDGASATNQCWELLTINVYMWWLMSYSDPRLCGFCCNWSCLCQYVIAKYTKTSHAKYVSIRHIYNLLIYYTVQFYMCNQCTLVSRATFQYYFMYFDICEMLDRCFLFSCNCLD